mmetsp:Transcript_21208/g.66330  ORF Transcript_21208/g.66330 Transcript_21208/m.66330 type:complete len:200 (+) Transcript_21208:49-648(+)
MQMQHVLQVLDKLSQVPLPRPVLRIHRPVGDLKQLVEAFLQRRHAGLQVEDHAAQLLLRVLQEHRLAVQLLVPRAKRSGLVGGVLQLLRVQGEPAVRVVDEAPHAFHLLDGVGDAPSIFGRLLGRGPLVVREGLEVRVQGLAPLVDHLVRGEQVVVQGHEVLGVLQQPGLDALRDVALDVLEVRAELLDAAAVGLQAGL